MAYGGKEMARSFRTVRGNTIAIAEEIPESKYTFKATPETRSVAELLAHIAMSPTFQHVTQRQAVKDFKTLNFMELVGPIRAEEAKPRTKAELIALLKSEGEKFATFLEGLSDSFLAESVVQMPGSDPAAKTRLELLLSPKEHEMHHRGQLMLIQRMIGLVPHLTRQMQERMAAAQTQAPGAGR